MTATITEPQKLWGRDFDEALGDSPEGALDRIIRRILADVPDITIAELDRITARAVEAGRAAILDTIATESNRHPPGPSALGRGPAVRAAAGLNRRPIGRRMKPKRARL